MRLSLVTTYSCSIFFSRFHILVKFGVDPEKTPSLSLPLCLLSGFINKSIYSYTKEEKEQFVPYIDVFLYGYVCLKAVVLSRGCYQILIL